MSLPHIRTNGGANIDGDVNALRDVNIFNFVLNLLRDNPPGDIQGTVRNLGMFTR